MRSTLATLLILFSATSACLADGETMILEGNYQKKNLFVSNCFGEDGVGFSVTMVKVNGEITSDAVSSSAFEIDLGNLGLAQGDPVTIQIIYDGPCTPKVLNPGALQPMPSFEIENISISEGGLLEWSSINESGKLPYIVEHYKWNKWVKVGEVDGEGTPESHAYKFQTKLVSGQNKFRVVQKNLSGHSRTGQPVSVTTSKSQPEFEYNKRSDKIVFSEKTAYEVYDMYGQIRKRGYSDEIDFSNLGSGDYYVNFDNTMEKIRKR